MSGTKISGMSTIGSAASGTYFPGEISGSNYKYQLSQMLATVTLTGSAAADGYLTFGTSGITVAWGSATASSVLPTTVVFPYTFSGTPYCTVSTSVNVALGIAIQLIGSPTLGSANFQAFNTSNLGATVSTTFYWFVIGPT